MRRRTVQEKELHPRIREQLANVAKTGGAVLYVDPSDGELKVRFADGHEAVIAIDS